jgi:NAD(P)H dehydrogenase (quinone)
MSVLEAAEHAGARRFVYLSVLHPHTPRLRHHLRMFAQIVLSTWGRAPAGPVGVPFNVDNVFSLVDLRDLGEAGVKVLAEKVHDSATYELAGPA